MSVDHARHSARVGLEVTVTITISLFHDREHVLCPGRRTALARFRPEKQPSAKDEPLEQDFDMIWRATQPYHSPAVYKCVVSVGIRLHALVPSKVELVHVI
jgi:hypothetical protein